MKRLERGEAVLVGDGRGTVLTCLVTAVDRGRIEARVVSRTTTATAVPSITVVQALPKGDRGELAVDLLTELGVDAIIPWSASRSITQWREDRGDKALLRWRRTAREASKQSRRSFVPDVADLASTTAVVAELAGACSFVLHESADVSLASVGLPSEGRLVLIVGPEGGISEQELAAFTAAGAVAVKLGQPVMRTSTAGAAALAALSVRLGRWG